MLEIKPTQRDIQLLKDIYENSFLSFYQIHEVHFKNCARPTVYNRLSKLIKGSLLKAIRVNMQAFHRKGEGIGVIYTLTKEGLKLVRAFNEDVLRELPVPINLAQLEHDLILADTIRVLLEQNSDLKIINSKLLHGQFKDQVPDAVIFDEQRNCKLALEVELNAKSNFRYREIISNYSLSGEFEKVLYLIKDRAIQKKIGGITTGHEGSYLFGDDTGKFLFCGLRKFFEGEEKFRLRDKNNCAQQTIFSDQAELKGAAYGF